MFFKRRSDKHLSKIILMAILVLGLIIIGCTPSKPKEVKDQEVRNEIGETIIMEIEGQQVTRREFESKIQTIKDNMARMEEFPEDWPSEDTKAKVTKQLEVMKSYAPKLIAYASLLSDYTQYAAAKKLGISVSQEKINKQVEATRERIDELPEDIQNYIDTVGEKYYWETYLPRGYERALARAELRNKITSEKGKEGWDEYRFDLIKETDVKVIDPELEGLEKERALDYLEEFNVASK
ncbi:SurA N-terminal domain-containing protein [Metallumcola ferriviriculae]|uniref:SurA N-terminal domain-containing protein n=1 Tax=Metallumcola ferriviriculae TaxID=3039180 RepID=A0AAU0UTG9_9FIRM|nr:SurA N-terminal domain-containing protein [Desulfitibacteraceae bacterium MK1]